MDNDLNVLTLYNEKNMPRIKAFNSAVKSEYEVQTNYEQVDVNFEWLEIMEDTVRYLDNILRNPNRFIVNEEDIIKIERIYKEPIPERILNVNEVDIELIEVDECFVRLINYKNAWVSNYGRVLEYNNGKYKYYQYDNCRNGNCLQSVHTCVDHSRRNYANHCPVKDLCRLIYQVISFPRFYELGDSERSVIYLIRQ